MTYFRAQAVSKKKIEGVKLNSWAKEVWLGYGVWRIFWGWVRKKTEPLGVVRKKTQILGGTKILVGMEKNYFLSMLPLVGGSPYSRGLLVLVWSRGNRAICRGT